jgi:hypothetical protein
MSWQRRHIEAGQVFVMERERRKNVSRELWLFAIESQDFADKIEIIHLLRWKKLIGVHHMTFTNV